MKKDEIAEWSQNIYNSVNSGGDLLIELHDAAKELGLNWPDVEKRYFNMTVNIFDIYFVLSGKPHPSKNGYIWN